jgi:hypothetical protein
MVVSGTITKLLQDALVDDIDGYWDELEVHSEPCALSCIWHKPDNHCVFVFFN